jgi:5'-nucleotidase
MIFLLSNDDGISAPGLQALASEVAALGEVFVVAPHRERSTAGHSLTLHKPLRVYDHGKGQYSTTGSPADCIYLGTRQILKNRPDFVLSGINQGANLGTDVHYSGTVAAAREAAVMNLRSYAFSLVDLGKGYSAEGFKHAAVFAKKVFELTRALPFPKNSFLNVNIPNIDPSKVKGMRLARQGLRFYSGDVVHRQDPRGRDYYWLGGTYEGFEESDVSDCRMIQEGWISLSPISLDCTHNEYYTTIERMPEKGEWRW